SANLDEAAWTGPLDDELLSSLVADIRHTRGGQPAWAVWAAFVVALPTWFRCEELDEVGAAVARLRSLFEPEPLRREDIAAARSQIRADQQVIRARLRDLHRRLMREP